MVVLDASITTSEFETAFTNIVLHVLSHVVVHPKIRSRQSWGLIVRLNGGFRAGRHVASRSCPRLRYGEMTEPKVAARYLIIEELS